MLPKQIIRVLFNGDMKTSVGESEGIVQAGIKFLYFFMFKDNIFMRNLNINSGA